MALWRDRGDDAGPDDAEIIIEAEIAEQSAGAGDGDASGALPVPRAKLPQASEVRALGDAKDRELAVRSVAVATAGGVVAGAATVVIARAAKNLAKPTPGLARRKRKDVVASRSFMVDVHLLKSQR